MCLELKKKHSATITMAKSREDWDLGLRSALVSVLICMFVMSFSLYFLLAVPCLMCGERGG